MSWIKKPQMNEPKQKNKTNLPKLFVIHSICNSHTEIYSFYTLS